ncbi:cytochrome ubiquinol oxidase subunit I [uncultured Aquimonas sp.]|uniref:cytochrome ubiquinol oxidase subunit I n=1 Tax=uncultured Aquimonas sp. TaxID=385483 RepID=UPI00086948D9|nr:cytochrome ubiquinol oxidase subunit I [uncultured Aquimonas sp.]ODU48095.1 MAG: cytochrome D ubiquinol oxidase subunit I [Xanthomonadaceae bacterium SCN 69-123]
MDTLDPILLARIQFAANISFHILFPTITIALGWLLLFFKLRWRATGDAKWNAAYRTWVKVFALSFALGVVSGITMSFQFGTNWPGFMERVGNIAGPLLGYEVLTAFFLEAAFLGIMLFGQGRVSDRVHTLATFLVAFGTTLSAFWILVLNSWMQTPVGFEMIDGQAHPTDWAAIVFNPSFPYRLSHMLLASGLTVAFLVAGLSAWRRLRGDASAEVQATLRTGLVLGAVLIPLQILAGDLHGLNTLEHQPAKVAAMEGIWETERGAGLRLFALPNEDTRSNDYEIQIPKLASLILTHELDGELKGLNDFEHHPPVAPVFWSFRVMVGIGLLMLAVSWLGVWQLKRRGEPARWLLRVLVGMTFAGWVATLAGWYVTEIGRQPWVVYGVVSTADAASSVPAPLIGISLGLYLSIYIVLLTAYISVLFHLMHKASKGELDGAIGTLPTHDTAEGARA